MLLIKLIIVSVLCLLSWPTNVEGEKTQLTRTQTEQEQGIRKDPSSSSSSSTIVTLPLTTTTTATAAASTSPQSNIYRIKRLNLSKDKPKLRKQQKQRIEGHEEQQKQQSTLIQQDHGHYADESKAIIKDKMAMSGDSRPAGKTKGKKVKGMGKNSHSLNKKLLNKLGFTKVKAPNSHNRKRLAIESRRHASPDDSHMFIIKLPPNMYYYANPKPSSGSGSPNALPSSSSSSTSLSANSFLDKKNFLKTLQEQAHSSSDDSTTTELKDANGKKVSFPFNSNGKPGRIYHWNLPVIKKILEEKQQRFPSVANVEPHKVQQLIDIHNIPTWSKPWENESIEKSYHHHHHDSMMSYKKSLKRKSPSYYAPANTVNKNSFNKYFSGNGKPKGFYVIKENQKKPSYYKNIVS
ncbi:uncharacterized protein LOC101899374 [Musca domestica]|uniref:Uncharacterized protein LOC101899374 n=1 Tax=Musca domestica TaxID=7370 RepID=A0ABM3VBA7_MUSDO|nr:uncharacterized protein LOC101899374 [Musca domestica]XP_058983074.1 uncharacterized protein LOC101899374 [Musca domestica]XP_058983075.1 uncharacterized protein LOC101899374 [Musca domestica]XP_058983076.1 uncharacterized protein LOC101899374 [Musca domestica]XP_058983077.1 uncharacterized protein LOC101899374 [Musca domestica]XP_058983078.1 uncharacterized protein LOC101899374 [Musca domestica]